MLSETNKARKKRFMLDFAVNPRGELWKKDEQNFGCKLMKRMGWKKGDGLGKNANGITQPIRLVQTHENEGLGYSKHTSDYSWNWLTHQDDYDTLLNQLKEQHTASLDYSSCTVPEEAANHQALDLEKKSKKSRKRVHYKRAIQGKDLSNRSAADWQCILGKKKKQKFDTLKPNEPVDSEVVSQEQLLTSVVTSNKYFMEKRLKLEAKRSNLNSEEHVELDWESSHLTHTYVEEPEQQTYDDHEKKRKKRKKKKQLKKSPKELDFLEGESSPTDSALGSEISGTSDEKEELCSDADLKNAIPNDIIAESEMEIDICSPLKTNMQTEFDHTSLGTASPKTAFKYKSFLECIKDDRIFKTCNLLYIKGYGVS